MTIDLFGETISILLHNLCILFWFVLVFLIHSIQNSDCIWYFHCVWFETVLHRSILILKRRSISIENSFDGKKHIDYLIYEVIRNIRVWKSELKSIINFTLNITRQAKCSALTDTSFLDIGGGNNNNNSQINKSEWQPNRQRCDSQYIGLYVVPQNRCAYIIQNNNGSAVTIL